MNITRLSFSELSKKVGFSQKPAAFPKTSAEVMRASDEQILTWHRFCPTPMNEKQLELINLVSRRFKSIPK